MTPAQLQVKIDFPDDVNPLSSSLYYFFAVVNLVGNIAPRLLLVDSA